jgi:DHA2 family multidrug resistance protein
MENAIDKSSETWKPSINPWLMIVPIIISVFMFALDETVSNVALMYIAGSFSASQTESTWIVTSYLVASGIIIPTVDFFCKLLGRKNYFMLCILVFTSASVLCGLSTSMVMIVITRFIQGLGGGSLLPLAQAICLESFPPEKRSQSMALFALTIIFAPTVGPIIGGWITENWSWHWIYLINLPIGILCLLLTHKLLEDPPYAKKQKNVHCDYWGLAFLSLWLVFLQIVLDKGNDADWFSATWICWMSGVSCFFGILFFISQFKGKNPLIDLSILKDKNFLFGTIAKIVMMAVFLASAALLPSMLQSMLGYTSFLSGLSMGSRGLGSILAMIIYSLLVPFAIISDKKFAILGICLLAIGGIFFGTINLNINLQNIAFPNSLFGAGMCLGMTTLTTLSFSTLHYTKITNASGLQNLLQNIGGAIGTSLSSTMISRLAQKHQMMMVGNLTDLNANFSERINSMSQAFAQVDINQGIMMAKSMLYNQLIQQSRLWAYIDTFRIFAVACLIVIPFIMLITPQKNTGKEN